MMFTKISPHFKAVLQAVFVTFLWSTSWVLIKIGLEDIPALTFAGLRYTLAFAILAGMSLRLPRQRAVLRALDGRDWLWLALLGVVLYTVTQGAQFVALNYLPAVSLSLLLNFTAVVVAIFGIIFLQEYPNGWQWLGVAVFLAGVLVYFYPVAFPTAELFGLLIGFVGMLANAGAALLGRHINRRQNIPPLAVTLVSMGIGAVLLLLSGIFIQGMPFLSWQSWLIIAWLAAVNTAFAFTLWNVSLRTLTAVESSIINNTMLIQIALLAWLFLGEAVTPVEGVGLGVAFCGILMVQLNGRLAPFLRRLQARSRSTARRNSP